jgi:hypothetical protein
VNYTFSKALGTINGFRSAYVGEKNLSTTDVPHVWNAFYSYELPFGKGRTFDPDNKAIRWLVSGWQISGITRYSSGTPLGPFTASCNVPQAGTCWASYNPNFTGPLQINGGWGHGDVNANAYIDKNAFISPPAFTYGNTPATGAYGLRNPHFANQDLSISRTFQVRENVRVLFGADTFNLLNSVRFGGIGTNITAANFGKVSAQVNLPRVVQFRLRLQF